jgi:hypothetical protein
MQVFSSTQSLGVGHQVPDKVSHAAGLKPDVNGPRAVQSFFSFALPLSLKHEY